MSDATVDAAAIAASASATVFSMPVGATVVSVVTEAGEYAASAKFVNGPDASACEAGVAGALSRTSRTFSQAADAASGEADLEQEDPSVPTDPAPAPGDPHVAGHLSASICNAVVRVQREYLGRGPTKARASLHGDIIVVLMQDTLTKAERSLAADGREEDVLRSRRSLQSTMRDDIVAAVEDLTGRAVIAFMSDMHIDPDLACEVLVLERDEAENTDDGGAAGA